MARGRIDSLQDFVWRTDRMIKTGKEGLSFLCDNPQISKFRMGVQRNARLLNEQVLPLLSSHFHYLTSLSLTWNSNSIPKSSLELIDRLTSLHQLRLSARDQDLFRTYWIINHAVLLKTLQPLQRLRKLAFSRETYNPGYSKYNPGLLRLIRRYYFFGILIQRLMK
jgi:hypothetical protein